MIILFFHEPIGKQFNSTYKSGHNFLLYNNKSITIILEGSWKAVVINLLLFTRLIIERKILINNYE